MRAKNDSIRELLLRENKIINDNKGKLRDTMLASLNDISTNITDTTADLSKAAQEGDLSENAAYTQAKETLAKLSAQKAISEQILDDIEESDDDDRHTPKDYIDVGCIFAIKKINQDNTPILVWKVFGILDSVEDKILTINCRAFKAFKDKMLGDVVSLPNSVNGVVNKYEVLGIYYEEENI